MLGLAVLTCALAAFSACGGGGGGAGNGNPQVLFSGSFGSFPGTQWTVLSGVAQTDPTVGNPPPSLMMTSGAVVEQVGSFDASQSFTLTIQGRFDPDLSQGEGSAILLLDTRTGLAFATAAASGTSGIGAMEWSIGQPPTGVGTSTPYPTDSNFHQLQFLMLAAGAQSGGTWTLGTAQVLQGPTSAQNRLRIRLTAERQTWYGGLTVTQP